MRTHAVRVHVHVGVHLRARVRVYVQTEHVNGTHCALGGVGPGA